MKLFTPTLKQFKKLTHKNLRLLSMFLVMALVAVVGTVTLLFSHAESLYTVPDSIVSDCSVAVDIELNKFIATVPDGSTIQFRAGACYGQTNTILLRDRNNLVIDGNGATFKSLAPPNSYNPPIENKGNANWRISRGTGIVIKNMTIYGNYVGGVRGQVAAQGQYTDQGISIWGGVNDTIKDVKIYNTDGEFVEADPDIETARALYGGDYAKAAPSRNITIDNMYGKNAARQCTAATAVDGFVLKNSTIIDCQQTGFDGEIDLEGELMRNVHILNNTFTGTYFAAIQIPILSYPGFVGQVGNIEIRGNVMTQAGDTCYPAVLIGSENVYDQSADNVVVADNTLLTVSDGVQFHSKSQNLINGSVTNNIIRKTVQNTGCDNPNNNPPYTTPVRTNGSPIVVSGNTYEGFGNNQNTVQPPGTVTPPSSPPSPTPTPTPQSPTSPPSSTGDTTKPSAPSVNAIGISSTQIKLSWAPSIDNVGVAFYVVYRNGVNTARMDCNAGQCAGNPITYTDSGLEPGKSYSYVVNVSDAAANVESSNYVTAFTASSPNTPPPSTPPPSQPVPPSSTFSPSDLNRDGKIDFNDAVLVIRKWNTADPAADINHDGKVDFNDAIQIIRNWSR